MSDGNSDEKPYTRMIEADIMSIKVKDPRRTKQLEWSKRFRERTSHMSFVPRPQAVRTIYLKKKIKDDNE